MPSTNFSFTSSSSSYSSTDRNGRTTGQAYREVSHTTPEGTTVRTTSQNLGERPVSETHHYDAQGRVQIGGNNNNANKRIEDVTDAEAGRD
ncbi:hypothetical protein BX600DRAFT_465203 [Xylariales sp. PMI_506]|nr:hypothetical protein BX600DRAFT_465203 [Xylariales sp. PMI_506]